MKPEIEQKLNHLDQLSHTAQNPKIVLEEIRLVSAEAFQLQDELMSALDEAETTETDIETVQMLFATREAIWDTINQIALREKEIKESHASREAFQKHRAEAKKQEAHYKGECSCKSECGCEHMSAHHEHEHNHHCCCHEHEHHSKCHHEQAHHCKCKQHLKSEE